MKLRSGRESARNIPTQSPNPVPQVSFEDIYLDVKNPSSYSSNVHAFMAQKKSISLHKRKIRNFVFKLTFLESNVLPLLTFPAHRELFFKVCVSVL